MKIETKKFNLDEIAKIKSITPSIGSIADLDMYNEFNFFQIKRMYNGKTLEGYAVIFLGYNSLTSNDVSLEDIVYWGNAVDYTSAIKKYLEEIKKSEYPFAVENMYYDPNKFAEISFILDSLDFKSKGMTR